jgi:CHASE3 domain sensor protein
MALISRFRPRTLRWRIYLLIGVLLGLLVGTVVATLVARQHATDLGLRVRDELRPAQASIAAMTTAYVDMENGLRGYLITRDERFLGPYEEGAAQIGVAHRSVAEHLADDRTSLRLLGVVDDAGREWIATSAGPLIAATRAGTLSQADQVDSTAAGRALFDDVRNALADLQDRIEDLIAAGLQSSSDAQSATNTITIACAAVAVLIGLLIILLVHMALVRPVNRLVASVGRASAGDLDEHISVGGPTEVVVIGAAVESMRQRILDESAVANEQSEKLARLEEADRIAQSLEQTAIRDLFAIGLALQSVAGRHPVARPALDGVIRDLDRSLEEMRTAVLGRMGPSITRKLRTEVLDLLVLVEQDLRITPDLRLTGDHDLTLPSPVANDVLDVLHDAVFATTAAGTAKEVRIAIALSPAEVRLTISGVGSDQARAATRDALADLTERAGRHGGEAVVDESDGRIAVDWRIPIGPETDG